jgi:uncharacterized protein GlcG (DUF336 family)
MNLINVATSLKLESAERILDGALAEARRSGMLPLTIAVLDAGGHLVALKREDGSGTARADIALGKAHAALGMGISSRTIGERLKERPAFLNAVAAATDGRFIAVPGGVLILNEGGEAIGAVGISGDNSDNDEIAALAGIHGAGFKSHPEAAGGA